jgi:heterodisulfide reductase subunit C
MIELHHPDPILRGQIESAAHTASNLCWTCGSCDFECPVNIATSRLRPQKLVRMANLGFLEELLELPEIWYCLSCRRCLQVCPNTVKPAVLIEFLRREALRRHLVTCDTLRAYKVLFARFQRARWHAAAICLQEVPDLLSGRMWCDWLQAPVSENSGAIHSRDLFRGNAGFRSAVEKARTAAGFTCGECSSACPVSCERSVFDPRTIFRMAHLGLVENLFASPFIWLCISCGRCTEACNQQVDGRELVKALQTQAIESGAVDRDFPLRLEQAGKMIYARFLHEVDLLFGFSEPVEDDIICNVTVSCAAVC